MLLVTFLHIWAEFAISGMRKTESGIFYTQTKEQIIMEWKGEIACKLFNFLLFGLLCPDKCVCNYVTV